ncbi:molecular chaperone GrpE [Abditibacterium utsteinense]|uniref:Protein GrpE n=1 Tax=Abditibacterium utsteinense TaxID=1960156 RepID=A0A2S8SQU6_9BACT|nr:nucleotide exchange factor GrpE [Abditibacterium utsteinense]PQV63182.1 molecular chaperone GrpE [Abditibacterium utsteinense]
MSNSNEEQELFESETPGETGDETSSEDLADQLAKSQEALAYLAAEFENYKRQTTRRIDEERTRAKRRVLETIFPAIDNFNLALRHAGSAKDVASFKSGLDYISQQLETALGEVGLAPIEAVGKNFDPTKHDALEEIEVEGAPAGKIVEETQRGYTLDGQVLRPSRVKVAK